MATIVAYNGVSYSLPATGEENWGGNTKVDGFLISLATNSLQKSGGLFTLSADIDFGATAGLKTLYHKSRTANVASSGQIRLANTDVINFRNFANGANLSLGVNTSDNLVFGGVEILISASTTTTFTNKKFSDSTCTFVDNADATKQLAFECSGITTSTIRTWTVPNASSTLVGTDTTQTLTNKKLSDSTCTFADNSDATKQLAFECSGITTSTIRTWTVPDASSTLVGIDTTQTLTNKTLTGAVVTDSFTFTQISTPSNPASGKDKIYIKSDDVLYLLTSGGTEKVIARGLVPTIQSFTSGTGTYTTPVGCKWIRVRMVGGGGGGGGSGTSSGGTGGTGDPSYFRVGASPDLLVANGGVGGAFGTSPGGVGGTASLGTGPIGLAIAGGIGDGYAGATIDTAAFSGGAGGGTFFGSGGKSGAGAAGTAPAANTGAGGGGGGTNGGIGAGNNRTGAGGGGGGQIDAIITAPSATYAYSVGAAGAAGTPGTNGGAGGAGAAGRIIVEEYYF